MWSRISDLAVKIDSKFGDVDGVSPEDSGGATPSSGADEEEEEDVEAEEGMSSGMGDEDGWGDDDGFGDDLEFGENDDGRGPSLEDGNIDDDPSREGGGGGASFGDDAAVRADDTTASDESAVLAEGPPPPGETPIRDATRNNVDDRRRPEIVTVSAPGKALIAGGYLVLESPNPGVVLAAEGCRFHATVAFRPPHHHEGAGAVANAVDDGDDPADDAGWLSTPLDVHSPQFDRVFSYRLLSYSHARDDCDDDGGALRLRPRTTAPPHDPNEFVERSLLLALGYIRRSMGAEAFHARLRRRGDDEGGAPTDSGGSAAALAVKLRADNDFYSQIARLRERGLDLTPQSLEMLEPFLPCPKDESTGEVVVNKTGMGSSAALVASMVGALLLFFGVISLPTIDGENEGSNETCDDGKIGCEGLRIAHNLSQICHCHAQGKVGSGFDISSAIYGSHIYTRFSEAFVNEFLEKVESSSDGKGDELQLSGYLSAQLVALVNSDEWDCTFSPIGLPPGLELLMADVCGGSESPSMARGILEWKKKKRKVGFMDDYYWKDLKRCNKKIVSLLTDQFTSQTVIDGLRRDGAEIISTRTAEQWKKPMPSSWHLFEGSR